MLNVDSGRGVRISANRPFVSLIYYLSSFNHVFMQITDAKTQAQAIKMSPFPKRIRPFTEPVSATQDQVIGPNKTLPDILKLYYPGTVPFGFSGKFGFLDRDNKERTYDPAKEDRFVFKSKSDIHKFHSSAFVLIEVLNQAWQKLGFPLKKDKDRDIMIPDSADVWQSLSTPGTPAHKHAINNMRAIQFILGNVDIMKKTCVVRTISAGWWAVSYKGKVADDLAYFSRSLNAHKRALAIIMASAKFKKVYAQLWQDAGDPLDTNPGYPFFTAQMDAQGSPVTRIRTVEMHKKIGRSYITKWADVLTMVDSRAGHMGMAGFPFCVAPLRRLGPGYKPQHQFNVTPSGMTTAYDEWGTNSQRVAWMVPYVYNVLLTPLQVAFKAVRMILPGLYHDGPSKVRRTAMLQAQAKANSLFMAEADYSNYDRFIPTDMMREIIKMFTDRTDAPDYWQTAAMYLHDDANLVWPDFSSVSDGNGWLFKPGTLGLMSGVKATSEAGTLVNSVVNAEVTARALDWSEDQLVSYLTQYVDADAGSKFEYYYVQSDDTELIARDPQTLFRQGQTFNEAVKKAGLKGSVELSDRFLMRHTFGGEDRPVPARVFQNTISNETPPENEIVFLAGLASRTDGLFGIKSVDPFQTGMLQNVTAIEAYFSLRMLEIVRGFVANSAAPSRIALIIIDALISEKTKIEAAYEKGPSTIFSPDKRVALKLHELRAEVSHLLADFELSKTRTLSDSWLYSLFKDRNIPSSQLILDQIIALNPALKSKIATFAAKEHGFFLYACDVIGVKPLTI